MILLVVSILLLLSYMALILYYRQSWLRLKMYKVVSKTNNEYSTSITIVIPARNEQENIGKCIESIIQQTYPTNLFELIIVDDYSIDATATVAASYKQNNIRIIKLKDFIENEKLNSFKKKAIEIAISLAKGDLIVTTDADCILQPEWLATIASFYEKTGAVFIAAPVVYNTALQADPASKKLLKIFQSLDFIALQGITGASVYKKIHSMCNGANLAYEKKAFYEARGFEDIDHIASGDDMLLMHKIQKLYPERIQYLKSTNVIAQTQPAETIQEFINQRIRWASKADKYPDKKIIAVLFLVYFFNAWIFFLAMCSFFYLHAFYVFLFLFIVKTGIELIFLLPVAKFFNKEKLLRWFLPAQPFHILYTLIAGWLGIFGSYTWKDRKVK